MTEHRSIYCCGCQADVQARLTDGREIYPHCCDLAALPFWKCDTCGNHVGCHHKTNRPTRPLGVIPTPELRLARRHVHRLIDPLWQSKRMTRKEVYAAIAERMDISEYHSGELRTIDDARSAYRAGQALVREMHA